MNTSKVNGDSGIFVGLPMPTENSIDIPPKTAGKKVIEEGEIELSLEKNTPELIEKLNKNKNVER